MWRRHQLCEIVDDAATPWNGGALIEWQIIHDWATVSPRIAQLLADMGPSSASTNDS